ncbi:MAG TPA: DUF4232 domain-containing protein [Acidimicrobiales bacterium]|nr:DUF4232 domain-containing protein [Acidimicrobiales bacterium]
MTLAKAFTTLESVEIERGRIVRTKTGYAVVLAGGLLVAGLLAGCSLSPSTSTPPSTAGGGGTTTVPPTTSGPTTTQAATTTTAKEVAACQNDQVLVSLGSQQGAAGSQIAQYVVTNKSGTACTMSGYANVVPIGTAGENPAAAPGIVPIPSTYGAIGGNGGTVKLNPAGAAVFFLKWSDVAGGSCYTVASFGFGTPAADPSQTIPVHSRLGTVCGSTLNESEIFPPTMTATG